MFFDHPYVAVKRIRIAHEYTLDQMRRCEYPRGRDSYGLVYALEGAAEYRFGAGERFTLLAGDLLFVSSAAAYTIVTAKPFRHYTVNFDVDEKASSLQLLGASHYLLRNGSSTPLLEKHFKHLVDLWTQKAFGYEMQSMGALYELLSTLYIHGLDTSGGRVKQRLQEAKEYIEQNFDQPLCLEDLAYLSNMSVTNFRREWARLYTGSPIGYRDSIRLHYAKDYLICGYDSVSEIAKKCGFDDASYFTRFFKKKTGMTPLAYKNLLRSGTPSETAEASLTEPLPRN